MFISIEGIEGTGKSTLARALAEKLRAQGRTVVETFEPGGTSIGQRLRVVFLDPAETPTRMTELLILTAARAELVTKVIRPALKAKQTVICDRFTDASVAYQGYGRGIGLEALRMAARLATEGLEPDVTILLDMPPQAGLARISGDVPDRIESESLEFHTRVRNGYLELASRHPRFRVIDGGLAPDVVLEEALRHITLVAPFYAAGKPAP